MKDLRWNYSFKVWTIVLRVWNLHRLHELLLEVILRRKFDILYLSGNPVGFFAFIAVQESSPLRVFQEMFGLSSLESEQKIRAAYEEAHAKDALPVFNEAESAVFNRDRAHRSWELSFTNEFLNCMEEYRGIVQVFTTNRLQDMDVATLHRFDYKLEFGYLLPDGIVTFYHRILRPLVGLT